MKTVGLRPFVVDDVAAATRADATPAAAPLPIESLDGRERLDVRISRWQRERERFRASQGRRAEPPTEPSVPDDDSAAP